MFVVLQDRRREIFVNGRDKKGRKMGSAKFKNCDGQDFVQRTSFDVDVLQTVYKLSPSHVQTFLNVEMPT